MSYQVLARKWRPRSFTELVGQEHVLRALINALDRDQLHHAFLFTGTRGVGKTTIARILAKSLNCETGVSSRPCGECSACREIDEGRFVDLIEVDAASRTKVEDTRELLENVQYAPTRGRYKVYLIDEVHMLSAHSFNALLKTLEEPPPHVKFLLATTDPQKLPVTILSRCLQFNLKRLPLSMIAEHLNHILGQEGVAHEAAAVQRIARAADGSMRDALSLLDQAIAYGGGRVEETEVRAMLGTIEQDHVFALLRALAGRDAGELLARTDRLAEQAPDFGGVLGDLIGTLQRIALAQALPDAIDESLGDAEEVRALAAELAPEDVQLFYQIALHGRRDLPLAPEPRGGFEMVLLRMLAFRPLGGEHATVTAPAAAPTRNERPAPSAAPTRSERPAPPASTPAHPRAQTQDRPAPQAAAAAPAVASDDWNGLVSVLPLRGAVRELAMNCAWNGRDGDALRLLLDQAHAHLRSKNLEERLQQALQDHYKAPVSLRMEVASGEVETPARLAARQDAARQQAAEQAIESDSNVRALRETFNARVRPDSVQPID